MFVIFCHIFHGDIVKGKARPLQLGESAQAHRNPRTPAHLAVDLQYCADTSATVSNHAEEGARAAIRAATCSSLSFAS